MAAEAITTGAWSARWAVWQVYIRQDAAGWTVIVWYWPSSLPRERRRVIGKAEGLRSAEVAIDWASSLLTEHGAQVFIDGRSQPLAKFFAFSPAPEIVP